MRFDKEPKFARQLEERQERREGERKLEYFIREIAEKAKDEGVPLTLDCRIDMKAFVPPYTPQDIESDRELVEGYGRKWQEKEKAKGLKMGEKLEMLKTAIFYKFLSEDFIIVRTSRYDDIINKVDNLIIEKETGSPVCAFDEVSEISGSRFEEKKAKVLERNIKGGGKLKYGLTLKKYEKGKAKLTLGEISSLPVFYLALPERHIEEGVKNLIPSLEKNLIMRKKFLIIFGLL